MIKGFIFDFNGTLFDDTAINAIVWEKLYREISGNRSDFALLKDHVIGVKNSIALTYLYQHLGQTLPDTENEALSLEVESRYRQYCRDHHCCRLVKGAEELLDTIQANRIPLNLATSSIIENVEFYFSAFHLDRWFKRELIAYDDGILPDKRAMYKKAAQAINLALNEILVFEDSVSGVDDAYAVHAGKIIVLDPHDQFKYREGVDAIIHDFTEFDRRILFK